MTAGAGASWWRRQGPEPMHADVGAGPVHGADPRRWPWALLAAVLGAGAGAAVALVVRHRLQSDAAEAQEPHELRAVIDRPAQEPSR